MKPKSNYTEREAKLARSEANKRSNHIFLPESFRPFERAMLEQFMGFSSHAPIRFSIMLLLYLSRQYSSAWYVHVASGMHVTCDVRCFVFDHVHMN